MRNKLSDRRNRLGIIRDLHAFYISGECVCGGGGRGVDFGVVTALGRFEYVSFFLLATSNLTY